MSFPNKRFCFPNPLMLYQNFIMMLSHGKSQIKNDTTEDLSIENHVCEVQLILRPFAELKVSCSCQCLA